MTYSGNASYLAHHGILGMKWGVRRYQNSDGSLTDAGKKRYDTGSAKETAKKVGKAAAIGTAAAASAAYTAQQVKGNRSSRKASEMTDDELISENKRAGLEKQYSKNNPGYNPNEAREKINKTTNDLVKISNTVNSKKEAQQRAEENERLTKEAKSMTDQELRNYINRANLEQQYIRLNQSNVNTGRDSVRETIETVGAVAGIAAVVTPTVLKVAQSFAGRKAAAAAVNGIL